MPGGETSIAVKELPHLVVKFGEFNSVNLSIILALVVQHVNSLLVKEFAHFGHIVDHFPKVATINQKNVSLKSGSKVLSLPLIQNINTGATVKILNPTLTSVN